MKKLISIALLSTVALLAAPKAPNKAQTTNAPVTTTKTKTKTKAKAKKVSKKRTHRARKAKLVKTTATAPAK